jgi:hypothetical protein
LQALADGKITAEEMAVDDKTNVSLIRQSPGFSLAMLMAGNKHPSGVYTIDALAKFLGAVSEDAGHATRIWTCAASGARTGILVYVASDEDRSATIHDQLSCQVLGCIR